MTIFNHDLTLESRSHFIVVSDNNERCFVLESKFTEEFCDFTRIH